MKRPLLLFALLLMASPISAQDVIAPPVDATGETIVAGLSQNLVSITTTFNGSEVLIYGAVKRDAPVPVGAPLEVVVTVQGPSSPMTVRRKERRFGIWMNTATVNISRAPSFYAIASSAPLSDALSATEDLRYQITIPRAIRAVGISGEAEDAPLFLDALIRLQAEHGAYALTEDTVNLVESTLFRADIAMPADLTEGEYKVRMFITRAGMVVNMHEEVITVHKDGFERWIFNLAHQQSLLYGLLSLVLAVAAGWGASALFGLIRR
ncbi:TIGR02186 family protein [Pseudorhodobacter sp.]|uniref:TIGR02186 family protein n=1 Tax=Pseudorhodobacter sp. TaxID=1934400 RepID=UPI002647A0D7|nr:TIGR02186 family protein [Pseudorhodobacter sp.]MDN5787183.1 TIGR02186 family protein [Pseudorhodobacter sp.]